MKKSQSTFNNGNYSIDRNILYELPEYQLCIIQKHLICFSEFVRYNNDLFNCV